MGLFYFVSYLRFPNRIVSLARNILNNDAKTKLAAALIRVRKKRKLGANLASSAS
jgi:hypothetical protein